MIRLTVVSLAVGALLVATAELAAQVCVGNGIGGPQAHYASGSFRSGDDVTGWG